MSDAAPTTLTGAPPLARFVLRADAATAARAGAAYGLDLPAAINSGASKGERGQPGARVALKLGPDEFWLIVPEAEGDSVRAALEAALKGQISSLVDVSHRQVGFVLAGPDAATLLSSGCPLDFDPRAFPVGMATRSVFHKIEFMVWRMAPALFRIEVARSFGPYFEAMIVEARHDLV